MTIHTCSYHCDRPECIEAQRDDLRARVAELEAAQIPKNINLHEVMAAREPDIASDEYCRGLTDGWNSCRSTLLIARDMLAERPEVGE